MKEYKLIIILSALFLFSCIDKDKTNKSLQINHNINIKGDLEPLIATFKYRNSLPTENSDGYERLFFKNQSAIIDNDTVKLDFGGGMMTGYHLKVNIFEKQVKVKMREYSCVYLADFIVDNQEVIIDKSNYKIGDTIFGKINLVAHHNVKKSDFDGERVIVNGDFRLRIAHDK